MGVRRNGAVFALAVLAATAAGPADAEILDAAEALERARRGEIVFVDIRPAGEAPRDLPDLGAPRLRAPWPNGVSDENDPRLADFFTVLRGHAREAGGRTLVLFCGAGVRSAEALSLARGYGLREGVAHVAGGLNGAAGAIGLLTEIDFSRR